MSDTKPGWKTSEMWATGTIAWLINDVMMANADSPWVIAAGCLAMSITASVYIWSRSVAKGGASA